MSIVMAGGIYCPLSPRDPPQRLHQLIEQTQCRLVLVHSLTGTYLGNGHANADIESILTLEQSSGQHQVSRLSSVEVTSESIAYVIFTSGSTGMPKAVSLK